MKAPTRKGRADKPVHAAAKPALKPALRQAILGAAAKPAWRVNPKWAFHYRVLLSLRERLQAERGEQLSEAAEPLELHSMDIADTATDEFDHDLALSHLSAEQDALYEVEEALRRIREDRYGTCEETGKTISAKRLRAVPWTRFCRETQARLEANGAVGREHVAKPGSVRESIVEGFEEAESAGEQKEEPEPDDETLWKVFSPPAERRRAGKHLPARQRRAPS